MPKVVWQNAQGGYPCEKNHPGNFLPKYGLTSTMLLASLNDLYFSTTMIYNTVKERHPFILRITMKNCNPSIGCCSNVYCLLQCWRNTKQDLYGLQKSLLILLPPSIFWASDLHCTYEYCGLSASVLILLHTHALRKSSHIPQKPILHILFFTSILALNYGKYCSLLTQGCTVSITTIACLCK